MAEAALGIELQPAPAGILGTAQGAGLHRPVGTEGGRTAKQGHCWPAGQGAEPMLVDMAKHHRLELGLAYQQLQQRPAVTQADAVKDRIPDRHRRMVHRHDQGQVVGTAQLPSQPGQLPGTQPAFDATRAVAVEQEQAHPGDLQHRRGHNGMAAQGGSQQVGSVVVAGQQGNGRGPGGQAVAQPGVTRPTLVLAEVAAEQQQIGGRCLDPGLLEGPLKAGPGLATPPQTMGVGQKVGIAELNEAHRPKLAPVRSGGHGSNSPRQAPALQPLSS